MNIWVWILNILETPMKMPTVFGWYHFLCLGLTAGLTVLLCTRFRKCAPETIRKVVFAVAVVVAVLEIYKQIVFTFSVQDGAIVAKYAWFVFPWQFCSTPMYVGLLLGAFRKGKVHDALCAYLATYALFAGLCVMAYPGDVYLSLIGINIQTMVCHGSMIVIGIWLLATGHVPLEHKTIVKAFWVFLAGLGIAVTLNEAFWHWNVTGGEVCNLFFVNPHFPGTLAVYKEVQQVVPYPWCLLVYIAVFTLAAYLILLCAMVLRRWKKTKGLEEKRSVVRK